MAPPPVRASGGQWAPSLRHVPRRATPEHEAGPVPFPAPPPSSRLVGLPAAGGVPGALRGAVSGPSSTSPSPPALSAPVGGAGGPGGMWVYESKGAGAGRRWRWRAHRRAMPEHEADPGPSPASADGGWRLPDPAVLVYQSHGRL
eukprot:4236849-Alexandrium_andersonii.AAC.1